MTQLTSRSYIVATYPNPTNDQAKAALGAIYDSLNESTQKAEVDIASASTIDIGAASSRKVRITGTTTITSFGTTYVGPIFIRFSNSLTITNNNTTLRTITGSNISTATGDRMVISPVASVSGTFDGWEIISYTKAGFTAASAGANLDITSLKATALVASIVATAGGSANALTAAFSPTITSLADGLSLLVRATTANTSTTPTLTIDALAVKTIIKGNNLPLVAGDIAGAGHWLELQYDSTLDKLVLQNPAYGVTVPQSIVVPIRQIVLSGPVDSSGYPTFLPSSSGTLGITTQNINSTYPLTITAANGFGSTGANDRVGYTTSNITWSGLTANTTNYLYVDISSIGGITTGSTTLAPIYQHGGTPTATNGQATFNISQMQMFVGNSSTAPQTWRVFVGEVVTGTASVTSSVAYAYSGRYVSQEYACPAASTLTSLNHNIGCIPRNNWGVVRFKSALYGYSIGDEATFNVNQVDNGSKQKDPVQKLSNKVLSWYSGSNFAALNLTNGYEAILTSDATQKIVHYCNRGW